MDILIISKYILIIAFIIMMFAALRASAYKGTSMGLLGSSVVVVAFAVALLVFGQMYNLTFYRDISLALIFFGFVGIVEYIQSALLLIAAFLVIVSAVGFLSLPKDMKNVVYARIHIIGIFDIACIIAMIGLGQYLLAVIYLILAPFTAHAIANAFYKSEDVVNNVELNVVEEDEDNPNPFIVNRSKVQELENEDSEKLKTDERFTISTLDINEEE